MYKIAINTELPKAEQAVVTIGSFDGLHEGHLQLFKCLNSIAFNNNYRRVAITFEPLPQEFFFDQKQKQRLNRLSLLRDKYIVLKQKKLLDELVILHFNHSIANLTAKEFIQKILKDRLNASHLVVGHDFKFAKDSSGSCVDLHQHNIETTVVEPFLIDGQRVSSSIIRQAAQNNQLDIINTYLGRNLHYTSRIIHGNKMGRKFGVPTINLAIGKNRLALWGIYIAYVYIAGVRYNAVASIGKNPTTNRLDVYKLEAHLLDVDLDLYGKIATVEILQFIRCEQKFPDLDSLFAQIHQDMTRARQYFTALIL